MGLLYLGALAYPAYLGLQYLGVLEYPAYLEQLYPVASCMLQVGSMG